LDTQDLPELLAKLDSLFISPGTYLLLPGLVSGQDLGLFLGGLLRDLLERFVPGRKRLGGCGLAIFRRISDVFVAAGSGAGTIVSPCYVRAGVHVGEERVGPTSSIFLLSGIGVRFLGKRARRGGD